MSPPPTDDPPGPGAPPPGGLLARGDGATWTPDAPPTSEATTEEGHPTGVPAGRSFADRFELLTRLGQGAMGEVWRARDLDLGRIVAVKIVKGELGARYDGRFLTEARATAVLEHPGVVPVHEVGRTGDGRLYYTMQEVQGTTLREHIARLHAVSEGGPWQPTTDGWTLRRLVEVFHTVCDTVAFAHARGIIHRDLKPENVMLGEYGEVFVVDWGLVKVVGTTEEEAGPPSGPAGLSPVVHAGTQVGQAAGTRGYMPPEQARGEVDALGPAADVYALGGVLYCLLTGHAPASPAPDLDALAPARVPEALAELCREAMDPAAARRPPDARALARRVRTWLDRTAAAAEQEAWAARGDAALQAASDADRHAMREALLSLVDADGHSRPRGAAALDEEALQRLVDARLVIVEGERARLADPALEEWPRLRAWVAADPEGQQLRHELTEAARGWRARGRSTRDLWEAEQVDHARAWEERRDAWLGSLERDFLAESRRQALRRRRQRLGALGAVVVLAALFVGTAWRLAEEEDAVATARSDATIGRLQAASAMLQVHGQDHRAMVLEEAVASLGVPGSRGGGTLAAGAGGLELTATPGLSRPAWRDDGAALALREGGRLHVMARDGSGQVRTLGGVIDAAWEPGGRRLAVLTQTGLVLYDDGPVRALADLGGTALAWDRDAGIALVTGTEVAWVDPDSGLRRGQPRGNEGRAMAHPEARVDSWWEDGLVARSWDGAHTVRLDASLASVLQRGFLPGLRRSWTIDDHGAVRLYDAAGALLGHSPGTGSAVDSVALAPDQRRLAVGGEDGRVRILDLDRGAELQVSSAHGRDVLELAWHPGGALLASGGDDDFVLLWDSQTGRAVARLSGLDGPVRGLSFSPDGRTLAVSTPRGTSLWSPAALPARRLATCGGGRARVDLDLGRVSTWSDEDGCTTDLLTGVARRWRGLQQPVPLSDGGVAALDDGRLRWFPASGPAAASPVTASWLWPRGDGVIALGGDGFLRRVTPEGVVWSLSLPGWDGAAPTRRGSWLGWYDEEADLRLVDLDTGALSALEIPGVEAGGGAWDIDGDAIFVAQPGGGVTRFSLSVPGATPLSVRAATRAAAITALDAADGAVVAVDTDGIVHAHTATGGRLETRLPGGRPGTAVALSPEGTRVAVAADRAALTVLSLVPDDDLAPLLHVDRGRRGALHTLAWLDEAELLGVGEEDAWTWRVPPAPPEPLALTNLRACREESTVVPVQRAPADTPWAPAEDCGVRDR